MTVLPPSALSPQFVSTPWIYNRFRVPFLRPQICPSLNCFPLLPGLLHRNHRVTICPRLARRHEHHACTTAKDIQPLPQGTFPILTPKSTSPLWKAVPETPGR